MTLSLSLLIVMCFRTFVSCTGDNISSLLSGVSIQVLSKNVLSFFMNLSLGVLINQVLIKKKGM